LKPGKTLFFTQNHDFIPTSGLAVTALALLGESPRAESWARLSRASPPRQPTPESRWALLRRDGVLDLRSAVARAILRCVAAFHRRKSVGAWTGTKLEVLSRARAAPGRTERVRLRRRVGGTAHARAWRRRVRSRLPGWHAAEQFQPAVSSGREVS